MSKSMKIIALLALICFVLVGAGFSLKDQIYQGLERTDQYFSFFVVYQNLANPYIRYVRIPEGLRKEQVAKIYSKTLAWNDQDTKDFLNTDSSLEGYYFPTTYIFPVDASGESVKNKMTQTLEKKVATITEKRNNTLDKDKVNIDTILKIASLIQREAAGKHDMNLISGIIWNRIWMGMSLDIDATLQYAKGNEENGWWPQPLSKDKFIDSPFNTYQNKGLPPTPIANPGLAAIAAAYNPQKTSCIFYFHDKNRKIYCSKTYAEHKRLIELYLK